MSSAGQGAAAGGGGSSGFCLLLYLAPFTRCLLLRLPALSVLLPLAPNTPPNTRCGLPSHLQTTTTTLRLRRAERPRRPLPPVRTQLRRQPHLRRRARAVLQQPAPARRAVRGERRLRARAAVPRRADRRVRADPDAGPGLQQGVPVRGGARVPPAHPKVLPRAKVGAAGQKAPPLICGHGEGGERS